MIGNERLAEHLIQHRIARYHKEASKERARRESAPRTRPLEIRSRLASVLVRLANRLEPSPEPLRRT